MGGPPGLEARQHFIRSEDASGYDHAGVAVEGVVVDRYDPCESANMGGWAQHRVDSSGYAGRTVRLEIRGETDGSALSHLLVDVVAWVVATAMATASAMPCCLQAGQAM